MNVGDRNITLTSQNKTKLLESFSKIFIEYEEELTSYGEIIALIHYQEPIIHITTLDNIAKNKKWEGGFFPYLSKTSVYPWNLFYTKIHKIRCA